MKRFTAICLSLVLLSAQAEEAAIPTLSAKGTGQFAVPPGLHRDVDSFPLEGEKYREGDAIVAIAAPHRTELMEKGTLSSDRDITVEEAWDFGDAETLGENAAQRKYLEDKDFYIVKASSDTYSTKELMTKLDNQEYVLSVEPDYYQEKREVSDPLSDLQWSLDGENTNSAGVRYSELNQEDISLSDADVPVVAVVDTGIDYSHEDLADRMWTNPYPDKLEGSCGYDFGEDDADPADEDGHGTHCAGIIGASVNNAVGIAGISAQAELMALKVFDGEEATNESIINAFYYIYEAQQLGVNIVAVNCSWGGGQSGSVMSSLIEKIGEAGAVFVFAAGNDGIDHDTAKTEECPYDINSPYIVTVGASDTEDQRAVYSDYGASSVDLFAPGSQILSTVSYDTFYPALLSAAAREEACAFYSSFDGGTLDTSQYYTTSTGLSVDEVAYSSEDVLGNTGSGSLSVEFSVSHQNRPRSSGFPGNHSSAELNIYLDVTDLGLSGSSYRVACDMGEEESGSVTWSHETFLRSEDSFFTTNGRSYLRLVTLVTSSSSTIYLDNISVADEESAESAMRPYDVYSGTSMAAPAVSAALAILSAVDEGDSAVGRIQKIYSCVRKMDGLSGYCETGGILDLSKILDTEDEPDGGDADAGDSVSADSSPAPAVTVGSSTVVPAVTAAPTAAPAVTAAPTAAPAVTAGSPTVVPAVTAAPTAALAASACSPTVPPASADGIGGASSSLSGEAVKILVKKLKINRKKAVLRYGKKLKLRVKARPAKATNKKIKWSVSKKKYARVSKKGVVRAKRAGVGHTVRVYARTRDGSDIRAFCRVKITRAGVLGR